MTLYVRVDVPPFQNQYDITVHDIAGSMIGELTTANAAEATRWLLQMIKGSLRIVQYGDRRLLGPDRVYRPTVGELVHNGTLRPTQ